MNLLVSWDKKPIGVLERISESTREYSFSYGEAADRAISLSLPLEKRTFSPAESRPFFEALLPEGVAREQIASQLRLATSDSYGLLGALGRDCAGALQIVETKRMSDQPSVEWLDKESLDQLIDDLPRRPLAIDPADDRTRLSLAGVQRKAVLARDAAGTFGKPLNGAPSTHILKPEFADADFPAIARNEFFCMRLARRCRLNVASVDLQTIAGRQCLVVDRYDRDTSVTPTRRLHQEDLCQALGLTPDFKYQRPGFAKPSYRALADLLDEHSARPGAERLQAARHALFNFLVGNADAHAKNISLLHVGGGVQLAPLYDIVCTVAYPDLTPELSLAIGDEFDPAEVGSTQWSDFAHDFGLQLGSFQRERDQLARLVLTAALESREEARREEWYDPVLDAICATIEARANQIITR